MVFKEVVVQWLSCVWLLATSWTEAHQASLSFIISWSLLKFMFLESVKIISSASLFSFCLLSFSASGSFLMSWLFTSGDQNIGASASSSVLSMNIQSWFPLGLIGFIPLMSKGLSRVFPITTILQHSAFFMVQLSHQCMTTGKNKQTNIALTIKTSKVWSFSFSISPSNEYLGLISFRIDWFDLELLAVQGTLKSLL